MFAGAGYNIFKNIETDFCNEFQKKIINLTLELGKLWNIHFNTKT